MSFKVVIVKTKTQSLKQAEQFLRNRQWQVFSTTNIRDAIAAVIQRQPDFILVAADHPNKKVRVLPKLIGQAFPVRVIGYVESTANSGLALLHECGLEYNVYPPISGPAIERIVLKMKKDDERRENEKLREKEGELSSTDQRSGEEIKKIRDNMHVSSSNSENQFQSAREMLQRLVNDDDNFEPTSPTMISGSEGSTGAAYSPTHGLGASGSEDPGYHIQKGQGMGSKPTYQPSSTEPEPGFGIPGESSLLAKPFDSSWDTSPTSQGAPDSFSESGPHWNSPEQSDDMAPGNWGKDKPPILEHDPIDLHKTQKLPSYRQDPDSYPDRDSIFVRGTQQALDESVERENPLTGMEELSSSSSVACITIQSQRFSGYLVAAMGKNRQIDANFLKLVKDRLFNFLRNNGEKVKDDEAMDLKLEEVDFEDWAIHQAEFLRKSIHGKNEIAMAFFPNKETSVQLEASANENMLKLDINELRDDVRVEFDLYIYMPTNQKYILYTPQGRKLFSQQRGRLSEKGITHMHLRKESEGQVKRYRAQSYLNDCIANYKTRPKVKRA